jgi:hypothetical protein
VPFFRSSDPNIVHTRHHFVWLKGWPYLPQASGGHSCLSAPHLDDPLPIGRADPFRRLRVGLSQGCFDRRAVQF